MTLHTSLKLALVTTLVLSSTALADWQADVHMKAPPRGNGAAPLVMEGKAFGTMSGMRMDFETPHGPMSTIVDWKARKVWNLMHTQKLVMASSMDRAGINAPNCEGTDIDACLVKNGFAKTGSDSANGHPCSVYEKDETGAGNEKVHVKLWRPTDLKSVMIVRAANTHAAGSGQVDFTNVKDGVSLDHALFSPPENYHSMGAGFSGGMPGGAGRPTGKMTPDEAVKMRDELLKQYRPQGQ